MARVLVKLYGRYMDGCKKALRPFMLLPVDRTKIDDDLCVKRCRIYTIAMEHINKQNLALK